MNTLYFLLLLMLIGAVCIAALPYIKNKTLLSKSFLITLLFIIFTAVGLYQFSGDKEALKQWNTTGKQHYQLQVQFNSLGGIEGIIASIKKKVAANSNDAQGWFILGKFYYMQQNYPEAKAALKKAHELKPEDSQINHYYELAVAHSK